MIHKRFWNSLINFNNMDIIGQSFGYAEAADSSEWEWKNFTMPFDKLYFMESGSIRVELLDRNGEIEKVFTLLPKNAYLIPCGNVYNLTTETGFRKVYMHVNMIMSDGYDLFHGVREIMSVPFDSSAFRNKTLATPENRFSHSLYAKAAAYSVISQFLEHNHSEVMNKRLYAVSNYPADLLTAIKHIRSSDDARVTVTEIARKSSISPSTLAQLFKDKLNVTPKKYMNERLYEHACTLLLGTDMSVKEIACSLHFSTPFAFSKFFKNHSGFSPVVYRTRYHI